MTISIDELTAKAMSLPGESRALLAERLVQSLDQEEISEIWLGEAKRRRDEVRSGQSEPVPGKQVMENVRSLISNR